MSSSWLGPAYSNHLASFNCCEGNEAGGKVWQDVVHIVRFGGNGENCNASVREVLLILKVFVECEKDIEVIFGQR